ncbi:MAG: hypothetical protein AMJ41_00580 [candidate division Zixibacteria bacterium DG_27]|nr:MAG: hypothetical protein AMJ41_00580 [candidate division Zixibacteria bacterium DG_27]
MIRKLTKRDRRKLIGLLRQLWPNRSLDSEGLHNVIEKYAAGRDYRIYGYEDRAGVVGIITMSFRWSLFYEGKVALIEDLVVDESSRRRGIGRKLVRFVEELISGDNTIRGIEVNTDLQREDAQTFWESCGYSRLAFQFRKKKNDAQTG